MKLIILSFFFSLFSLSLNSHEFESKYVLIDHPWIKEVNEGSTVGAGYFKITNKREDAAIKLLGAKSSLARKIEIHEMIMIDEVMKMRPLKSGLLLQQGESIALKPMGKHLMFIGVKNYPKRGEMVEVELLFEKIPSLIVKFKVDSLDAETNHDH